MDNEERQGVRYQQRGVAKRKRIQQYRKNKARAKAQSKRWRQKNQAHLKRYRQRAKRNPMKHRLRRRATEEIFFQLDPIAFFDIDLGEEGVTFKLDTEEAIIHTSLGEYGIDTFINRVVFPTAEDEDALIGVLDDLSDDGVIDNVYTYDYDRSDS